ncbi:hypothetical protein NH340_JMT07941 [Sarcoptes scabiei]|nr:hypothetical protein NH340_JMT07941 [Sarcoptes scabiei]
MRKINKEREEDDSLPNRSSLLHRQKQQQQQQQQQQLEELQNENLIKTTKGSIRGKRNNVRDTINNYYRMIDRLLKSSNEIKRDFQQEEKNLCVIYVTSLTVIRKTLMESKAIEDLLFKLFVRFELRDVYLHEKYRQELIERLDGRFIIPAMFIDGSFIGILYRHHQKWWIIEKRSKVNRNETRDRLRPGLRKMMIKKKKSSEKRVQNQTKSSKQSSGKMGSRLNAKIGTRGEKSILTDQHDCLILF